MARVPSAGSAFPHLLRQWRRARRLSQLELSGQTHVSARHLSFLETGRARPSRAMIQVLSDALEVPLSERNTLLLAAGYAPIYGEHRLDAPALEPVRRTLRFILKQQEPYPAIVVDGQWNVLMANAGTRRFFDLFLGRGRSDGSTRNAMHVLFDPGGLRPFIENWEELAGHLMQTVHREAAASRNPATERLRDELLSYPGVPPRWKVVDPAAVPSALLAMRLRKGSRSFQLFETITTLASPLDVTLQQVRIDSFYPADRATERFLRALRRP